MNTQLIVKPNAIYSIIRSYYKHYNEDESNSIK